MSTRETWDKIYRNFTEFNPIDLTFYKRLSNILVEAISDSKSILEVGSGSGILTSFFQNRNMFSVGLDRSKMPIKIAKEKFNVKNSAPPGAEIFMSIFLPCSPVFPVSFSRF